MPSLKVFSMLAKSDPALFKHLLRNEGLQIIGKRDTDPLNKDVQVESVLAIASTLTEDVYDQLELNPHQASLQRIAEDHGYMVAIEEGLDQHPGTEIDPIKGQLNHPEKPTPPPQPEEGGEGGEEEGPPA